MTETRIAYTVHPGSGPRTIVLLHSLALNRSIWDRVVQTLQPEWTVITCDLPGHGGSGDITDGIEIADFADSIAAALRTIGVEKATVLGISLGGSVAQAVAIRAPELVEALALVDTTAWYGETAPESWDARAQQAEEQGLASLSDFQLERWFTPAFLESDPARGEELLEIFKANTIGNYVATCHAFGRMDLRADLAAITAPTAVVVGEHDLATPPDHAELLATTIPDTTLTVLADRKHLSLVEDPAAVLGIVEDLTSRTGR